MPLIEFIVNQFDALEGFPPSVILFEIRCNGVNTTQTGSFWMERDIYFCNDFKLIVKNEFKEEHKQPLVTNY